MAWKANAHRHSFASYRLEQTKDAQKVALEMGNSASVVLRSYADVVHAEDAAKYWALMPSGAKKTPDAGEAPDAGKVVPMRPAT